MRLAKRTWASLAVPSVVRTAHTAVKACTDSVQDKCVPQRLEHLRSTVLIVVQGPSSPVDDYRANRYWQGEQRHGIAKPCDESGRRVTVERLEDIHRLPSGALISERFHR